MTANKRSPVFIALLAFAGGIVFCCCAVLGLRMMNSEEPLPAATRTPGTGATVVFDVPTKASTATQAPAGESRGNPYPVDSVVDIGGGMRLTVMYVARPANQDVEAGNRFNNTPSPGYEYVLVRLNVLCTKPENETCNFSTIEIKTVGFDGQVRDDASVAGVQGRLEPFNEFFGGASIEGNMVFLVGEGDTSAVLMYDPLIFGDPLYIALE